ncbi:hypothetical protein ACSX1A_16190 [Pontibacter sp. MBLB2868]|uniref:hypothetical protein n=1 Tax=Pontibacter sp. MBLB2868 TaxID=3451555 RepID=UPI003F755C19
MSVNYLNEDQELTHYETTQLLPDGKLTKKFSLPSGTSFVRVRFTGHKVRDFSLSDFTINSVPVQPQDITLHGERYVKNDQTANTTGPIHVSLLQ